MISAARKALNWIRTLRNHMSCWQGYIKNNGNGAMPKPNSNGPWN